MLQMEVRSVLIAFCHRQHFCFAIQVPKEGEADRRAGAAAVNVAIIANAGFRSIFAAEAVGQNDRGMSREVGDQKLRAVGGSNNYIHLSNTFATCSMASIRARLACMYSTAGINREVRNEFGQSSLLWLVSSLSRPLRVRSSKAAAASASSMEIMAWYGSLGNSSGIKIHAQALEFIQRGLIVFVIVLAACAEGGLLLCVIGTLFLFRFSEIFFFFGLLLRLWRLEFKIFGQISNAQFAPVKTGVPIERCILHRAVVTIRPVNGVEHQRAIFHRAADGAQLVHGPGKGHGAGARNKAKCRDAGR